MCDNIGDSGRQRRAVRIALAGSLTGHEQERSSSRQVGSIRTNGGGVTLRWWLMTATWLGGGRERRNAGFSRW